jgi:competence protein ComEC
VRRPFLGVCLLYALGIAAGDWAQPPASAWIAAGIALSALFWTCPRGRHLLLPALLVWAGWTNQTRHLAITSPDDLRIVLAHPPQLVSVQARLHNTPQLRRTESHGMEQYRSLVTLDLAAVSCGHGWIATRGRVLATVPDRLDPQFHRGRKVKVSGVLQQPPLAAAPGLFDYRQYLHRRGIHQQLWTGSTTDWQVLNAAHSPVRQPWSDQFQAWARSTLARGLPIEDDALRLRWAMLLGWRTALTDEVSDPFMRSGTMHVFAISGLHVSIIALVWLTVLRLLVHSRAACGLLVAPALWAYAAATGWQPSAVRATVMMTVVIGGWTLRRPPDLLNSLAGAAFLILLWDPQQLFHAGFQLSFGVVFSLAVLLPRLLMWRDQWLAPDPFVPDPFRPRMRETLRRGTRHLATLAATSAAAWLGSLPWAATHFHLVTPISLLTNIVVIPLAGVVVVSGMASLLCGPWWPWATECFNHTGWLAMEAMIHMSSRAAALPGAWWPVPTPSPVTVGVCLVLLASPLVPGGSRPWRRLAVGLALAALCIAWGSSRWSAHNRAELVVLAVGGGDAIWVDTPGSADDLLVDTGDPRAVERVVAPYLRTLGRHHLPRLLLTHGDVRHAGGVPTLLNHHTIGRAYASPARSRSLPYRRAIDQLRTTGVPIEAVSRGMSIGPWRVLHPAAQDPFTQADDQTVVLTANFHGRRVLLCSDLGQLGQSTLLEREPDLRADVVISGMPANTEPLCDALLDLLCPRVLILSTGDYPANQNPSRALRLRLERRGIPVFMTGDQGAVSLTLQPGRCRVRTPRSELTL